MRPALSPNTIVPLQQWQSLPSGEWLQQQVEANLSDWLPRLFGYHLLKLGPLASQLSSSACPIQHQISLANNDGSVHADLNALPFQQGTIDACIASFCLEFDQDPHRILREIDRVMICGGHLVLIGFNGFSPLGIGYMLPHLRKRPPWNGRLFNPSRVEDWLGVLGYRILETEPVTLHSFLAKPERYSLVRQALELSLPKWGSVYMIVARKTDCPLTPVRKKWRVPRPTVLNPIADLASFDRDKSRASNQEVD
ncbi:class I SAM-dependent methyltransferase [Ferrimonas lipolytica]|uniref:Methyltransferase domain-containing protein n=1 Tax=Ferrimonas lipolytica TaxID=2724191 RepID=A0A6H1UGB0_9GAMM|nr:methyltransferase domain-containing protein [Ferrimonas lipolytica]QIZ76832.1 methyltransferase domain-containing protein [Ferrimonas lipolytica]